MKLLYILSEYLPDSGGGIISHYARILPRLVERGHEVTVLLASKNKLDHPDYEIDGVRVRPLKSKILEQYANRFGRWLGLDIFFYLMPVAWAVWAQAQENFDYDVVEVTDWALLFLPWVAAEKRAPTVVSLHGSCGQVDWFGKGESRSLDGDWVRMVEAAALRGADVVHANSRANAEFWQEKTGREILVIPPAYGGRDVADGGALIAERGERKPDLTTEDTEVTEKAVGPCLDKPSGAVFSNPFTGELAHDCEIRGQNFSSPATSHPLRATAPQARKALVVGRLQNWKGAEVLCQALRLAPEIEIEWAGGDTDWGSIGLKASEYLAANYSDVFGKRFRWIGRLEREQVAQKMKLAGFLVVPSLWDVFNLTVAESMEAGLPVICSTAAGAEMLIKHGLSGFLFDSLKPEELASSLNLVAGLSANDRLEIAIRAQESVKTHLNEQRILKLLEDSYTEAIKRGASKKNDLWLESLLSVGPEQRASPKSGFLRRAIRKVGRVLSNV
jgi:glycosyltransferase involved in cell wall biosynthesis